jgi:hypothetical protein
LEHLNPGREQGCGYLGYLSVNSIVGSDDDHAFAGKIVCDKLQVGQPVATVLPSATYYVKSGGSEALPT